MAKRILIIDDDEDILTIMGIIFGDEGYDAILYQKGTSLEYLKILHPDLIMLDIRISGYEKTGAQICMEIKKELELANIPIILVSAETNVDLIAQDCGANDYINKPFEIENLLAKVKEFLP